MLRRCAAAIVMVGALVAPASATAAAKTVSPQDETYLTTAIAGDRFEIQGGTMAAGKTGNAAVKTLAQRLVSDHSKSLKQALGRGPASWHQGAEQARPAHAVGAAHHRLSGRGRL